MKKIRAMHILKEIENGKPVEMFKDDFKYILIRKIKEFDREKRKRISRAKAALEKEQGNV